MDNAINYTFGFSQGVVQWHWPIAIYLLLAGISGGALIMALSIRFYKKQKEDTNLLKAASLVSFITIALGMVFLVADLKRPLLFWKILINYNFNSVMSIGVIAISVYIPLTLLMCLYVFEEQVTKVLPNGLRKIFSSLMGVLKIFRPSVEALGIIFALIICAYTGFLISVLIRFPLLNTAVLPALFIASGLSAGIGASGIVSAWLFKEDTHSKDMKILHTVEWPVMLFEVLFIFMLFVSLLVGNEFQKTVVLAFSSGAWSYVFWIGVVFIGFGVPLIFNFLLGKKVASSNLSFYLCGLASIIGVLSLRLFVLYAGQTFSV